MNSALRLILLLLAVTLCSSAVGAATADSTKSTAKDSSWFNDEIKDSGNNSEYEDEDDNSNYRDHKHNWGKWNDVNFDFDFFGFGHDAPTISLFYGGSRNYLKDGYRNFARFGILEAKIGNSDYGRQYGAAYIIKNNYNYLSVTKGNLNIASWADAGTTEAEMLRIGGGWERGLGYKMGPSALMFYSSYAVGWTKTTFNSPTVHPMDADRLALYNNAWKFGWRSEAGVTLHPIENLGITAGYETALLYPRVLFWKAAGSLITEAFANGLVDEFMDRVMVNSPAAAPIVGFVLKNAVAYGFHELRKEKVNFPFGGDAPLTHNTLKIGATFIF